MARYEVTAKSFINDAIREVGDIVEYEGKPGSTLKLIQAEPKHHKGKAKAEESADLV